MGTATRRSNQRQRRQEVRAQIMLAAAAALRERPYRELKVEELMSAAGLTRTLFYRYFDDLADLVVRLLDEAGGALHDHERRLAETGIDTTDALRLALSAPVETFAANGPLIRAVADAAAHDERIDRGYRALCDRFAVLIEGYLRDLADRERTLIADPRQTARALNLMNLSYLLDAFGGPDPNVSEEVALQTLTEIWAGAILAAAHRPRRPRGIPT